MAIRIEIGVRCEKEIQLILKCHLWIVSIMSITYIIGKSCKIHKNFVGLYKKLKIP